VNSPGATSPIARSNADDLVDNVEGAKAEAPESRRDTITDLVYILNWCIINSNRRFVRNDCVESLKFVMWF